MTHLSRRFTFLLVTLVAAALCLPGLAAAQDKKPAALKKPAEEKKLLKKPAAKNDKIQLNFQDVKWDRVIRTFSDHWDFALHYQTMPQGSLDYTDPRMLTQLQAMDILNSLLMTQGFVLARRENILLVHNLADGPVPDAFVPFVQREDLGTIGEFELRKVIFKIEGAEFEQAETEVRNMVEPAEGDEIKLPGKVVSLPATRQLRVTDVGRNLRELDKLITLMGGDGGVKAFKFDKVTVTEGLDPIKALLGIPEDLLESTDGSVRLAVLPGLNTLLVTSSKPEVFKQVEAIIKLVNVERKGPDTTTGPTPTLEIYSVAGPDPETVLKVLQSMLSGNIGVRLTNDPVTGNIIAYAVEQDHALIKGYIKKLAGPSKRIRIWPMRFAADPQIVVATITELLGSSEPVGEGDNAKPGTGPKLLVDTNTRELIAFGNEEQLNHIENLMKMRRWTESDEPGKVRDGRPFRVIPFHPDVVPIIKQHFKSFRKNPIEIIDLSGEREKGSGVESIDPSGGGGGRFSPKARSILEEYLKNRKAAEESKTGSKPEAAEEPAPPTNKPGSRSTRRPGRSMIRARFAVHTSLQKEKAEPAEEKTTKAKPSEKAKNEKTDKKSTGKKPADNKPTDPTRPAGSEKDPVVVTIHRDRIVITSRDLEALDVMERMLADLVQGESLTGGGGFKVFVLKHVSATAAKETLDQVLTGDTGGGGAGAGLLGDVASGMMGGIGGAMVEGLLGSGSAGGIGSLVAGTPLIVAEDRLNALIVQAGPDEVQLIRDLLEIIDRPEPPDNEVARRPGIIPVRHTSAQEVATNLRELYSDRLVSGGGGSGGGNQQPSPREFIEALRGGNRKQGGRKQDPNANKMNISVDTRSNSLLVVAPQALYDEVKEVVAVLDYASGEPSNEIQKVIVLKSVSPQALASALQAIGGGKVKTVTSGSTTTGTTTTPPGATPPGQPASNGPPQGQRQPSTQEQVQRIQALQQFLQQRGRGDDAGGGGGGLRGRGGGGGSPFGGGGSPFGGGRGRSGGGRGR